MPMMNLAEQVAQKIRALPDHKQQEVLKSIESFIERTVRDAPRKYTGATWANAVKRETTDELRPNIWRFTIVPRDDRSE